jgi:hypothetical protein
MFRSLLLIQAANRRKPPTAAHIKRGAELPAGAPLILFSGGGKSRRRP